MNSAAKKRIMFSPREDFYFATYSMLVLLDSLGLRDGRFLKDYRKLAFLTEFVNDDNLIYIIEKDQERELSRIDREYLFKSYTNGLSRRSETLKILFRLEKSDLLTLRKGNIDSLVDVSLLRENIPPDLLNKELFGKEYGNAKRLSVAIQRLSALTLNTMLSKIYEERGIKTWAL